MDVDDSSKSKNNHRAWPGKSGILFVLQSIIATRYVVLICLVYTRNKLEIVSKNSGVQEGRQ